MQRFFNTTGPCNPEYHYLIPPSRRLVHAQLSRYIESQLYWVLHAPRQTGKTTFLQSWMREINAADQAIACYVSVERCQQVPEAEKAIPAICNAIIEQAGKLLPSHLVPKSNLADPYSALTEILSNWSKLCAPKPLVVLFDEVDVLQDQALISFLRQLRSGFATRGVGTFPVSVALVGMRDLKDYLIQSKDGVALSPGSPFNIKQDSATLSNFTREDVFELAHQHTIECGQTFSDDALSLVFDFTRGQPWLTNAILQKCTWLICSNKEPVEVDHILTAREMLIKERAVHLDSIAERLKDPRIKRVVQTILVGDMDPTLTDGDDFRLATDMGLVILENGTPAIANPIYRETIARVLSEGMQNAIPLPEWCWQKEDGSLDMDALLKEFQSFWGEHSEIWETKADYTEAFPHLLLMAFLQRVINGQGRINREYAAGRGRVDLAVWYKRSWNIIEIKLISQKGRAKIIEEGLKQISKYRDTIDSQASSYLIVFDRTPAGRKKSWEERLTWEVVNSDAGKTVTIVGG